ncbi:MAG TPA: hypothetical protein VGN90_10465 [Pyrinomonadaceae bacterium]|jgi:hypothetical protein|nr:hypothetical protein [Pyrinomonadaceae bacterium]
MLKSLISDQSWALMTEGQKVAAVLAGQATLKQLSEGLLDGSEQLRNACREFLAETDPSFENLPIEPKQPDSPQKSTGDHSQHLPKPARSRNRNRHPTPPCKNRFGLPGDFVPRLQRFARSVLLELNVYRLPNGQEFIASRPTGTLGSRHLYALLSADQYLNGRRGSVYVRPDGRIFDYSVDGSLPLGDLFDTGYTMADLERTGRYAPELGGAKKKRPSAKVRRAVAGG